MAGSLSRLSSALRGYQRTAVDNPLAHLEWLPHQHRFLTCGDRQKLLRTGNQLGKSTAGCAEMIWRCLGTHPYLQTRRPPIEAHILCASWSQSLALQRRLWALVPKAELHPECEFDPVRGWRGRAPVVRFKNGSMIRIRTTRQSSLVIAGSTIQAAMFDEPPPDARLYAEVAKRLMHAGDEAALLLCLTPINAGPLDWLQELCEAGQITDIHSPLTPEAMIPVGSSAPLRLHDGTLCDAEWIERIRAEALPTERNVTIDGEWCAKVADRVFLAFDESEHVNTSKPRGTARLYLGIDYGSSIGRQVSCLVAVSGDTHDDLRLWVLDETDGGDRSTIADDADDILHMLSRHGIRWPELDGIWGDRLYIRGAASRKSNRDLMTHLGRRIGTRGRYLQPQIRTVKKGKGRAQGSVQAGIRWLHQLMLRPGAFNVHPRCISTIQSLNLWDLRAPYADPIDALRYSLNSLIFSKAYNAKKPTIMIG